MTMTPEEREDLLGIADGLRDDSRRLRSAIVELARSNAATRRRLVFLFCLGLVMAAQLVAFHANRCGVGLGPISSLARLTTAEQLEGTPRAAACDVSFPLLAHTRGGWPSAWNLVGLALYVGAFTVGAIIARREPDPPPDLPEGVGLEE